MNRWQASILGVSLIASGTALATAPEEAAAKQSAFTKVIAKGKEVETIGKKLDKAIENGSITTVSKVQSELKKAITTYKSFVKKQKLTAAQKATVTKKYITPNEKKVHAIQKEIVFATKINAFSKEIPTASYDTIKLKVDYFTKEVNGIKTANKKLNANLKKLVVNVKNEAKKYEGFEIEKIKEERFGLLDDQFILEESLKNSDLYDQIVSYRKLEKTIESFQRLIHTNPKISSESMQLLTKQYVDPAKNSMKPYEVESRIMSRLELVYTDLNNKLIDETKIDLTALNMEIELRQKRVNEGTANPFDVTFKKNLDGAIDKINKQLQEN